MHFREESVGEREHQTRVEMAHARVEEFLKELGAALPWFAGFGVQGPLTDDDAKAYFRRRDMVRCAAERAL